MPDTIDFKTVHINTSFVFDARHKEIEGLLRSRIPPLQGVKAFFILGAAEVGGLADQIWLTLANNYMVPIKL